MLLWNQLALNVGSLQSVKESIISSEGIVVDFSDQHDNYHICKEDTLVHHSKHHPNIENRKSAKAYKDYRKTKSSGTFTTSESPPKKLSNSKSKPKNLFRLEINEFVTKKPHLPCYRVVCFSTSQKKRGSGRFGSLCAVMCQENLSVILLGAPGKWKMQMLPSKERKHQQCRC